MLGRSKLLPRKGFLVDNDYSVDLDPSRQAEYNEASESGEAHNKEREDPRIPMSVSETEFNRGQRTVSHNFP